MAEAPERPVETAKVAERLAPSTRFWAAMLGQGEAAVNVVKKKDLEAPPPVIADPQERALEHKLKLNPKDQDAKADVGSDQSMDASDPSSATQPGSSHEPAPSSGFPEESE